MEKESDNNSAAVGGNGTSANVLRLLAMAMTIVSGRGDDTCNELSNEVQERHYVTIGDSAYLWAGLMSIGVLLVVVIVLQFVALKKYHTGKGSLMLSVAARSKGSQSQGTYKRKLETPRFQVLPGDLQG